MTPTRKTAKKKPTSGPTITPQERALRGYGSYMLSLPHATSALLDELAARHRATRSAVVVMALGALVQVTAAERKKTPATR